MFQFSVKTSSTISENDIHFVKSVQIRSFFWSAFSGIQTEYEDLRSKSPYSIRIQENMDQKEHRTWTLSRSDHLNVSFYTFKNAQLICWSSQCSF